MPKQQCQKTKTYQQKFILPSDFLQWTNQYIGYIPEIYNMASIFSDIMSQYNTAQMDKV